MCRERGTQSCTRVGCKLVGSGNGTVSWLGEGQRGGSQAGLERQGTLTLVTVIRVIGHRRSARKATTPLRAGLLHGEQRSEENGGG